MNDPRNIGIGPAGRAFMGSLLRLGDALDANPFPIGTEEDAPCNRAVDGTICDGMMIVRPDGCACHINPPCSACLDGLTCDECGWRGSDEG